MPTDHHIVVNELRLHYLDWGRHAGPPLVFLHGGRLTAHTWDLVCLALCTDFHCLAVDQRGHGDSEWSPVLEYQPDAHARDIGGLIHALDLQRPVLVGQSLGGLNAMTYATHAASQLAGVVLLDVGPDVQSNGAKRITSFVADPGPGTLEDFVERARLHNPGRDPRLLRYSLLHNLRRRVLRRRTAGARRQPRMWCARRGSRLLPGLAGLRLQRAHCRAAARRADAKTQTTRAARCDHLAPRSVPYASMRGVGPHRPRCTPGTDSSASRRARAQRPPHSQRARSGSEPRGW